MVNKNKILAIFHSCPKYRDHSNLVKNRVPTAKSSVTPN